MGEIPFIGFLICGVHNILRHTDSLTDKHTWKQHAFSTEGFRWWRHQNGS